MLILLIIIHIIFINNHCSLRCEEEVGTEVMHFMFYKSNILDEGLNILIVICDEGDTFGDIIDKNCYGSRSTNKTTLLVWRQR